MTETHSLTLHVAGTSRRITVTPERLVVAGYTAKDEAAVQAHIRELAAIGVPPPPKIPTFYPLSPSLLTAGPVIEVDGEKTSGEVEPVILRHDGRFYLGVGSDHTDRERERQDIAASKAACPKPLGDTVAEIGPDLAALAWDDIVAGSSVDGWPYQDGSIAALRHPTELLERMTAEFGDGSGDLVLYCGTLALLGGEFVHGTTWRIHLRLPGGPTLTHAYETTQRSQ